MAKIHETLNRVCESNARLEAAVVEQKIRIHSIESEITLLREKNACLVDDLSGCKNTISSLSTSMEQTTKLSKQLVLPFISDVLLFLGTLNKDGEGRVLDEVTNTRFERYRTQVIKASEGNPLTI